MGDALKREIYLVRSWVPLCCLFPGRCMLHALCQIKRHAPASPQQCQVPHCGSRNVGRGSFCR